MSIILPALVYALCFLTAAVCAGLLARQYRMARTPVLLWSAACFVLLAASDMLILVDRFAMEETSLRTVRLTATLLAVAVLLYGFIWESESD